MLDNILNSLRRGVDRARTRSEEVGHATRLRFEIFQLSRELDALYGRLGRAYHSGAEVGVLQPIRDEITRVDDEIAARERLISEIGVRPEEETQTPESVAGTEVPGGTTVIRAIPAETVVIRTDLSAQEPAAQSPIASPAMPTPPASVADTPGVPSAASVFNAKRGETETDSVASDRPATLSGGVMDPSKRALDSVNDQPNHDYQDRVDEGQTVSQGNKTDADLHGSSAPIPPLGSLAANREGIDRAPVQPNVDAEDQHERLLRKNEDLEARRASADPDPLD